MKRLRISHWIFTGVVITCLAFAVLCIVVAFGAPVHVTKSADCSEYLLPIIGVKTLLGEHCMVPEEDLK